MRGTCLFVDATNKRNEPKRTKCKPLASTISYIKTYINCTGTTALYKLQEKKGNILDKGT